MVQVVGQPLTDDAVVAPEPVPLEAPPSVPDRRLVPALPPVVLGVLTADGVGVVVLARLRRRDVRSGSGTSPGAVGEGTQEGTAGVQDGPETRRPRFGKAQGLPLVEARGGAGGVGMSVGRPRVSGPGRVPRPIVGATRVRTLVVRPPGLGDGEVPVPLIPSRSHRRRDQGTEKGSKKVGI